MKTWRQLLQSILLAGRGVRRPRRPQLNRLALRSESLEPRLAPAVFAAFAPANNLLSVFGDGQDNTIEISRNEAGEILVNDGAVPIVGGTPSVANVTLIQVFGQGGNDTISLGETNGALPQAHLFGGAGDDVLTGGAGVNLLFGQSGHDSLTGGAGVDMLFGGTEDDVLVGGDGNDLVFGESGNDRMVWNPGDDTDLNEGGSGVDTVEVNGGNGAEVFTTTANGTRVRLDRLDPAPFSLDIGTSEKLVLHANGGNDSFSATGNLAALIQITVDGGAGNDTLLGSNGADLLLGGDGDDVIDGNQGNDTALMGSGNDTFRWDPGDGSDTVEGQDGSDTMQFNGSGADELMELSANGQRLRFSRNVGNIVMDVDGTERIDVRALGGADTIVLNALSGTDVTELSVDLASTLGGANGDAQVDTIIVQGSADDDVILAFGNADKVMVFGTPVLVNIVHAESANDRLVINGRAGDDIIVGSGMLAGAIQFVADGGDGNDVLLGGEGNDVMTGGSGDDVLLGGLGLDVLDGGAGDNIVIQ